MSESKNSTSTDVQPSLIQWHLGALAWSFAAGNFVVAGEGKDFANSKEPLEYVFSAVWDILFNLFPLLIFMAIGYWGVRTMVRHRQWQLPSRHRNSARVLVSLPALAMLVFCVLAVQDTYSTWLHAQQAGAAMYQRLLPLLASVMFGGPWLLGLYRTWRPV